MTLADPTVSLAPGGTRTSMRAAVVAGPGQVRIAEVALPEPGPGEIRVRIAGCGVCASNLGPWAGPDWMRFPTEPGGLGHEGWGVVDATGEGVAGFAPGDPVATLFQHGYAEFDAGPAALAVKLPAAFAGRDFPGEPLGCAMNVLRRAAIRPGQVVAIVGAGFLGAILTRLATAEGARVVALSRRKSAREVAERMGAEATLPLDDAGVALEAVRALTDGRLCDRVIEATGKQGPLDLAAELARERGRLVIAGYHQDGPRQVNMQLWNWRGLDVINAHERDEAVYLHGMREAVEAVETGALDPGPLITHAFPLEALGAALDMTRDRPEGFLKAVVRP